MSEDEGTEPTARGIRADDEPGSFAESESVGPDDHADERDRRGTDTPASDESDGEGRDTEATARDSSRSHRGPDTTEELRTLLDRIAAYDESLAHDVSAIVETAREVNETVDHQRNELSEVRERNDEQADTIDDLHAKLSERQDRIEELESELTDREDRIEELEAALKRKQADFQNYKKRAKKRQEQLKSRATEDLVGRLVGVRDNLKRALEEESDDAGSLREGVDMTLREFDRVLADENVEEIDPEPGSDVDPQRHEVMVRIDSDQPEGTIAEVFTPGYEMGEKVIQTAQVTVSNGELADEVADADSNDETGTSNATTDPGDAPDGGSDDWEFEQSVDGGGGAASDFDN